MEDISNIRIYHCVREVPDRPMRTVPTHPNLQKFIFLKVSGIILRLGKESDVMYWGKCRF